MTCTSTVEIYGMKHKCLKKKGHWTYHKTVNLDVADNGWRWTITWPTLVRNG